MGEMYQGPNYTLSVDKTRRDIDVARDIARLYPNETPFAVFLMRARKVTTPTAEFIWYDSRLGSWWTKVNHEGGYAADATQIVVDDETIYVPYDVIKVPRTGEVMLVTAVATETHTATVIRGYGVTAAAALNDNDNLMRIGNAQKEFSTAPQSKIKQPSKEYNYTQIFRTTFDQSMTGAAEALKTNETERVRLRKDKGVDHRMDIERGFIWGERKEDVSAKRRMTGGLLSFIKTNVNDIGAISNFDEDEVEDFCAEIFKYGSKSKLFVCGSALGSKFNKIASGKIQTQVGQNKYGLRIATYMSFHGDLHIVTSQTFEQEYAGWGISMELKNVDYRPLSGRDTKLRANIQAPDADGWMDEYLTEAGLRVRLEETHGVFKSSL
jgi:hypothetical protein